MGCGARMLRVVLYTIFWVSFLVCGSPAKIVVVMLGQPRRDGVVLPDPDRQVIERRRGAVDRHERDLVGLWIFSRAPNTRAQVSRERVDSPFADELV